MFALIPIVTKTRTTNWVIFLGYIFGLCFTVDLKIQTFVICLDQFRHVWHCTVYHPTILIDFWNGTIYLSWYVVWKINIQTTFTSSFTCMSIQTIRTSLGESNKWFEENWQVVLGQGLWEESVWMGMSQVLLGPKSCPI